MLIGTSTGVMANEVEEQEKYMTYNISTGEWTERVVPPATRSSTVSHPVVGAEAMSELNGAISPFGYDSNIWTRITSVTSAPYYAIVNLKIRFPNKDYDEWGTGFVVGDGKILTAAHCIKNIEGYYPTSMTAYFGRDGGNFQQSYKVNLYTVSSKWLANDISIDYDYGIVSVPISITASTGRFGMYAGISTSQSYNLTGYPNSGDAYENKNFMYKDSGYFNSISSNYSSHLLNSCGGMSGSPIYGNNNYAVAIHTRGKNTDTTRGGRATNLTSSAINFVNNY